VKETDVSEIRIGSRKQQRAWNVHVHVFHGCKKTNI